MLTNQTSARIFSFIGSLLLTASGAFAACAPGGHDYQLDWNASYVNWQDGDLSGSMVVPDGTGQENITVDVTFAGATNRAYQPTLPRVSNDFYGSEGAGEYSLAWGQVLGNNSEYVTITLNFSKPINDLSFFFLDVDRSDPNTSGNGFRDSIEITALNIEDGSTPIPSLSTPFHTQGGHASSTVYLGSPIADNQAGGYNGQAQNGNESGRLDVSFNSPVTQVQIEYSNKLYPPTTNPAAQAISVGDLSFCSQPPPSANIQASKVQILHSETSLDCEIIPGTPDPEAAFAGPGACIEYQINASNIGEAAADDLTITDSLDGNMIFKGAVFSGFNSSGTGFGLSTPSVDQDCSNDACLVTLNDASLAPGGSGQIIIRAAVK